MKTKKTVCLLLCLLMLFSLSGCRYSDVLQKIIYNQQKSQEIDEKTDIKPNENNENNEEQTDDLKALENTAEADTTNLVLAQISVRTPAKLAPIVLAGLILWFASRLNNH